ncbi:MAG TPA: prolyl oligopeptidase family serine peptidase [Actinomycetota bacterium]|nr:prolyl oligopeptidase family serine peptidase [Actinomycetota bacterium]
MWRVAVACVVLAACASAPSPTSVADARAMEQADALPLTAFYDTPPLADSRPGDLLRQEPGTGYDLPEGASAVRILYHSLDASGDDVATSGVVLIPAGSPPEQGWPVIAWAHGTSGVARMCAPSAMKDVYYGDEGLFPMVQAGYAVVATDYHGLGTQGRHQYSNRTAQVNDVITSIPAARQAVPTLGDRWVVDGHSQGGVAAWGVDQVSDDPGFLGAVSVAGAVQGPAFARHLATSDGVGFYMAFMTAGIKAADEDFDPGRVLGPQMLEDYPAVTNDGCLAQAYETYADLAAGEGLNPEWEDVPEVQEFFDALTPTDDPLVAPLLVIAGDADQTVPIAGVEKAVQRLCAQDQPVTYRRYPGLDHDPTMEQSTRFQLEWIGERFAGKPATSTCPAP